MSRTTDWKDLLARELESADIEGFVQAAKEYQGDAERELADLEAGRHPLQRSSIAKPRGDGARRLR